MSLRIFTLHTAASTLLLLLSACGTPVSDNPPEDLVGHAAASQDVREARLLGETMLRKFQDGDAAGFVRILPDSLRTKFGEAEFSAARKTMEKTMGHMVSFEYSVRLENPLLCILLWKVRFERKGSDGKIIRQDVLFRLMAGKLDGHCRVVGFNFI